MIEETPIDADKLVESLIEKDADREPVSVEAVLVIKAAADLGTSFNL